MAPSRTYIIIANPLCNTAHWLSFGAGIFEWTAIQVEANIVEKAAPDYVPYRLVPDISALRTKSEGDMLVGSSEEKPNETYSRVKRIIFLED